MTRLILITDVKLKDVYINPNQIVMVYNLFGTVQIRLLGYPDLIEVAMTFEDFLTKINKTD